MLSEPYEEVALYLAIEDLVLGPTELSEFIGVSPDKSWTKGEARGRTGKHWESNGWTLEVIVKSELNDNILAPALLQVALRRFRDRVSAFAPQIQLLSKRAAIYVTLSIRSTYPMGIEIDKEIVQLLADLGCTFQLDIKVENAEGISS